MWHNENIKSNNLWLQIIWQTVCICIDTFLLTAIEKLYMDIYHHYLSSQSKSKYKM